MQRSTPDRQLMTNKAIDILILIYVALLLAAALTGCGGGVSVNPTPAASSQPPVEQPSAGAPESASGGPTDIGPSTSRAIGGDPRLAVRNECWYALDPAWLNKPNDDQGPSGISMGRISGCSKWHYISTDGNNNALRYVLSTYGGYVSDLIPFSRQMSSSEVAYWIGQLANDAYAMNFRTYRGVGHGAQCVSFATMILYRARGGYKLKWSWGSINPSNYPSAINALPGDLVFYKSGSGGHVAVCVRNYGSGITVVDSNYVGGNGNEVIARHNVSSSAIGNTWKAYSGRGRWY
jgi:hypothetical protein